MSPAFGLQSRPNLYILIFNSFSGVVHLGVASRDRAVADIAAALRSLFLAAVTPSFAGSAAAGPLIAGLILSLRGVKLSIPRPCYLAAQAIVGCMIAGD